MCGFYKMVSRALKSILSLEMVRNISEKSWVVDDMNGKPRFLQKEMQGLVSGRDGLLLNSHCTLYKSAIEEVRIWGWPLQTVGLLTSGFSSWSFTILSGRVTEWSDGKVGRYVIRKLNASWLQRSWGASTVQLDPNTWILEYRWSTICDNQRLLLAALAFLKNMIPRMLGKMQHKFWLLSTFGNNQYLETTATYNIENLT
ncbi:hypothetical protein C1H46_012120 [Malus baccata]|uniref:Uncharacterized protein n=1 Tax=Malus baccata TaxID=106549 RepID=A0A540MTY5_MALBA|nr:hypothetical protein C1H46_012120 [Malus baccata]